jgi:RNA-directed DNA polymerase
VEERICDQPALKLLRAMLRAGVMEDGRVRRETAGTAQGGVISPVMCNVYLHWLDRAWDERDGVVARYADDLVVMCWSRGQAEAALERLTALLADLGLEPKAAKTRIVQLEAGGEGFDFLGFHHRLVRSRGLNGRKQVTFLARWPADKAVQRARDRIRELTCRSRLLLPVKQIVEDLNRFLGGWAAYFRFGNSAARFEKIRNYARMRLALFIGKRHRRSREFGWSVVTCQSPNQLGLVTLSGIVVDPRPFRDWRGKPNAGSERRRRAVCGKTACTVRGGGDWRRSRPGQGHWGGATGRETGGHEGPRP